MDHVAFRHPLFEMFFIRAAGYTSSGGAEMGECLAVARAIKDGDADSWHAEWTKAAERLDRAAQQSLAGGHAVSAREGFLRAANYYRTAVLPLIGEPLDRRTPSAYENQLAAFTRAAALMAPPAERIEIPFDPVPMPGWVLRSGVGEKPRPLLIVTGGYDSMAEEQYFLSVPAALARGYDCLLYDGPGQGGMLIRHGLRLRHDWENVLRAVVDSAVVIPGINKGRIVLVGESLGGYLAPRAAAFEPRLAALVADPGQFDVGDQARKRFPLPLSTVERMPRWARDPLFGLARRNPFADWRFRRGMWTHGASSPLEYIEALTPYRLGDLAAKIECPTLVCHADADPIALQARQLFDALTCPKAFLDFTSAEGAGDHCEAGARALFNQRVFDWLDETTGHSITQTGPVGASMRAELKIGLNR